ncbi:hypothetical protein GQ44DRAFT_717657 [Phaeosphaeriaceae sp. PMI808]|nr:hypothetical protein GQ44DRAFT_717657 [Phaeosphaeriaceae sp. PMI808]
MESIITCFCYCEEETGSAVRMKECPRNSNIYCCGSSCTCSKGPLISVDPHTGEVKKVALGNYSSSPNKPTWWYANSSATIDTSTTSMASPGGKSTAASTASGASTSSQLSSSSLSTGAGAGIGVGCAFAIVGAVALVWATLQERRRRMLLQAESKNQDVGIQQDDTVSYKHRHEISSAPKYELDSTR